MIRTVLLAAALFGLAGVAQAQQLSLGTISDYLNGLKLAQAEFTQINDDGTISTGRIYIKRPGKIRFEYNPPESALVVASAGEVAIVDAKSNQPPETYPLKRTPLGIILQDQVDLDRAEMVTGHAYDGTATTVTAQDPEHPEYGNIQLKFTGDPVELRQWIINDDAGGQTTVILGALDKPQSLSNDLFDVRKLRERANR